ncbi:helix-turn-helix domain-containing protein [Peptoniphilus timonensis]|uniref:helix-turn-helix domain-containing protein n=1 Tax=Peptoniphilus timonensis TaxID=1268254 RepID=UPI0002E2A082|nr:helix-turn-helix transcriptional regulator [Peptoniphilus timonensis]
MRNTDYDERPQDIMSLIKSKGYSAIAVASILGLSRNAVYKWKYKGHISSKNIDALADLLEEDPAYIKSLIKHDERIR